MYTDMAVFSKRPAGIKKRMDVGRKIETMRKRKNISREELADRLGVTATTVYRKERGQGDSARDIKTNELPRWAKALECSVEELMDIDEPTAHVLNDREMGILGLLQLLFSIIVARNLVTPDNLKELLAQQMKSFQVQNQQGAIEVMDSLIMSLGLKPHESGIESIRKLLKPAQG